MALDFSYLQLSRYLNIKFSKAEKEDPSITTITGDSLVGITTPMNTGLMVPVSHVKAVQFITDTYQKLNINQFSILSIPDLKNAQVGDIITMQDYQKSYIACVISNDDSGVITWPEMPMKLLYKFIYIHRINLETINNELLNLINDEVKTTIHTFKQEDVTGKINVSRPNRDGLLQIGDIKFLVSPTQISFVTQNGYEYFPTMRTAGNPKIPTLQEIKSINLNLIFPNADSINNQLLPLFGMYKRTPFVPLYNQDICEFFQEIREKNTEYIPIALDSISIESVRGFPNTLQASLNILPFQHMGVGETFQALETFQDVRAQQFVEEDRSLDIIEKQLEDRLLGNESYRLDIIKNPIINHTYNFEKSEPFRAYYQAIIGDRNYVETDLGEVVIKTDGKKIPLSMYRPTKEENKLRYYKPEGNQKSVKFKYSYISEEFRAFSKTVSEKRLDAQEQIASSTKYLMKIMLDENSPEFEDRIHTALYNRKNFLAEIQNQFNGDSGSFIEHFLGRYGINVNIEPAPRITGLLSFMIQYAAFQYPNASFIVGKLGGPLTDLDKYSKTNKFFEAAGKLIGGKFYFEGIDTIDLMNGIVIQYNSGEEGAQTIPLTLKAAARLISKKISESLNKGNTAEEVKLKWAGFFEFILDMFSTENESVVDKHALPFKTAFLPIDQTSITIDNKSDIIDGWSINFANKFVPMNLQGFKYPFYQHVGSEDINLSLAITSLQHGRLEGLKEKFSLLNDRLCNSAKVVLFHAPELINELDPRLTVEVANGNIFNVFGLNKVVYNSSNISSIAGQPNAWAMTVSLTQAAITIKDYQSVTEIGNYTEIEDRIINFISRMGIDENGEIIIYNYLIDYEKIKEEARKAGGKIVENKELEYSNEIERAISKIEETGAKTTIIGDPKLSTIFGGSVNKPVEGESLRDLNMLLMDISFYIDTGIRLLNTIDLKNSDNLDNLKPTDRNAVKNNLKLFQLGYIQRKISGPETTLFKDLIKKQNIRFIVLNLIKRQQELKDIQADLFIGLFKRNTSFGEIWAKGTLSTENMLTILSGATLGALGIGIMFVPSGITQFVGSILIKLSETILAGTVVSNLVGAGVRKATQNKLSKIADEIASSVNTIINGMKYSFVGELAQEIIRDPIIRKKLFGDLYEKNINTALKSRHCNCYKDFDVPVSYTNSEYDKFGINDIKFSPDFYLYNKDISKIEKLSYSENTIKRMIKIGRISSLLSLKENHDTLEAIQKQQDILFNNTDPKEKNRILSEFQIITNAKSSEKELVGDPSHESFIKDRLTDLEKLYTSIVLENKKRVNELSPDKLKINLIQSARIKRIIELKLMQVSINTSLAGAKDENSNSSVSTIIGKNVLGLTNTNKDSKQEYFKNYSKGTIGDASLDSLKRIQGNINLYFDKYFHTTNEIEQSVNVNKKKVNLPNNKFFQKYLSQPNIRRFEEVAESLLTQIIILSHAIQDYYEGSTEFQDLDIIPELAMLSWWNWRNMEDMVHQLGVQKDFLNEDNSKTRGFNSKMFPTFKIYFVEEDSKIVRNLDDYYSYDAIQSIDIVSNKYSAGKVATILLSNSVGNLTNKFSLMRERGSVFEQIISQSDNIFLGNLDIKPGTKIIIKIGYSANDKFLKTHFVGRIIEMTPGPIVRLVCQSYGAQLNHEIVKMHFGILSTQKEHGDIATSVMDAVPSLEGLGKPALLGLNASKFSGKNIQGADKHLFERFLLSNVTSRVNAGMFTQDNPRDDNIYLPYNMIVDLKHHPTFDWIVYNQSVWQSLNEISLYHRNTFPIVKLYNDDFLSTMQDLRETIVIGNKSGYYKHTDSFSLSTMDVKGIENTVDDWNKTGGVRETVLKLCEFAKHNDSLEGMIPFLRETEPYDKYYYPLNDLKKVLVFFRNKRNATVILYRLLQSIDYDVPMGISKFSFEYLKTKVKGALFTKHELLIKDLMSVSIMGELSESIIDDYVVGIKQAKFGKDTKTFSWKIGSIDPIFKLLNDFNKLRKETIENTNGSLYNIKVEDFLHVEPFETDNTKDKFVNDPRYSKIQKHHLITDQSDILSNNIVLSQDFNNAVSIYYMWEPKFYDSLSGISREDIANLRSFTIKAFGDIRDKDIRLLETYQKNVDTNWWDIRDKSLSMLNSYSKKFDPALKYSDPTWKELPSFVVVGISMLQREIEKMYRGTIQIIGNPNIEPMDILHIEDYLNDMHGTVEVEEVVHSISPSTGFITTITPSMITYDRDPRTMADVATVRNIIDTADIKRSGERVIATLKGAGSLLGIGLSYDKLFKGGGPIKKVLGGAGMKVLGGAGMAFGAYELISAIWGGTMAAEKKYTKFIYDSMCNVFGRDCINFSALLYHGSPYMCGFDGIDYTSITTLINHQIRASSMTTRLASSNDPQRVWLVNLGDLEGMDPKEKIINILLPGGNITNNTIDILTGFNNKNKGL